jgi:hypothetical protein
MKEHVSPGTFVAAVGADNPEKQELDPHLMASAAIVVDVLDQCASMGDLHHALEAGVLTRHDIRAELADVITGRKPRALLGGGDHDLRLHRHRPRGRGGGRRRLRASGGGRPGPDRGFGRLSMTTTAEVGLKSVLRRVDDQFDDIRRFVSGAPGAPGPPPIDGLGSTVGLSGSLTFGTLGGFTFVPNNGFSGSTTFTYRAVDNTSLTSGFATVTVTIAPNQPPVAVPDTYAATEDVPRTINNVGALGSGVPL